MEYKSLAEKYVSDIDDNLALIEIEDSEDSYIFTYQSKKFLETENPYDMLVGQGPVIISKIDSRLFVYGSALDSESAKELVSKQLFEEKEIRQKFPAYDLRKKYLLTINKIKRKNILIECLINGGVSYVMPEVEGDSVYRVPKLYNSKQLEDRMSSLPVSFEYSGMFHDLIYHIHSNDCCDYEIEEFIERQYESRADRATEHDLKPIW